MQPAAEITSLVQAYASNPLLARSRWIMSYDWHNRIKTWNNIVEIGSKVYRQTRQSYLFDRAELACMLVEAGFARVTEIPTPPELYEDLLRAERP